MDNIVDLIRNAPVEQQPTPTEKAQIVIMFTSPQPPAIPRYASVKKGEKEFAKLKKAWDLCKVGAGPHLHDMSGDMYICTIDLTQIAVICFINHAERNKFVPIP